MPLRTLPPEATAHAGEYGLAGVGHSILLAAGASVYRSDDYGDTWQSMAQGNAAPDVRTVVAVGTTFVSAPANSDSGISVSRDGGWTWGYQSSRRVSGEAFDTAASPTGRPDSVEGLVVHGEMIWALGGTRTYLSTDAARTWQQVTLCDQPNGATCSEHPVLASNDDGLLAAGEVFSAFSRSGTDWTRMSPPESEDVNQPALVGAGHTFCWTNPGHGTRCTEDHGAHWCNANRGLPAPDELVEGVYSTAVGMAATSESVYLAMSDGVYSTSSACGHAWSRVDALPRGRVRRLERVGDVIYAVITGSDAPTIWRMRVG